MSDSKDKPEEAKEQQPNPKKPPGYEAFEELLKQVVKAPPLRKK